MVGGFTPACTSAKLFSGDGREIPSVQTPDGGRILVQATSGQIKAVNFDFANPPPRPQPYQQPIKADEGTRETSGSEGVDWGFGKTTK